MLAIVYSSYDTATTVWSFVLALLVVLTAIWYVRRRR
ncbi:MHYT domain-containing protein [Streptomyces sp. NPDC127119]